MLTLFPLAIARSSLLIASKTRWLGAGCPTPSQRCQCSQPRGMPPSIAISGELCSSPDHDRRAPAAAERKRPSARARDRRQSADLDRRRHSAWESRSSTDADARTRRGVASAVDRDPAEVGRIVEPAVIAVLAEFERIAWFEILHVIQPGAVHAVRRFPDQRVGAADGAELDVQRRRARRPCQRTRRAGRGRSGQSCWSCCGSRCRSRRSCPGRCRRGAERWRRRRC